MAHRCGSTRREFITSAAVGAAVLGMPGLAVAGKTPGTTKAWRLTPGPAAKTRFSEAGAVVRIRHAGALSTKGRPPAELARRMVDRAVMELTGTSKPQDAWAKFAQPGDRVLIKPNAFGSPGMVAHPETALAIAAALQGVGVPPESIIIYDQYNGRMRGAGYRVTTLKSPGVRVLNGRLAGYEGRMRRHAKGSTKLALPVLWASVIIDVPVMKDHDLAGVTGAMKNLTHGVISNPASHHRGKCKETIPALWAIPEIKDKTKLILCDGFKLQCDGGPNDRPANRVPFDSVFATTDAVAMDRLAWDFIEEVRKGKGKSTLTKAKRPPLYLEVAAAQKLGVAARDRIKLVEKTL